MGQLNCHKRKGFQFDNYSPTKLKFKVNNTEQQECNYIEESKN